MGLGEHFSWVSGGHLVDVSGGIFWVEGGGCKFVVG